MSTKDAIYLRLFTNEDGTIAMSDDVLSAMLERSLQCEDYETADKVKRELDRRSAC